MKIAIVGGGSTYTPELIAGFRTMNFGEVVLADPDAHRLSVVGRFARRLLDGHSTEVSWTTDLDAALDGAQVVVIQLRVGGQTARISDETFPLECGCIGQETTGAGGLAKALRTVPVVLDVADRAAKRAAPGAWIVDFTNPVGIVTRALLDAGHRAVGLCNVAIGFQRRIASLLSVEPDAVELDHVGLNHLTWERAALVDGVDRLPELLPQLAEQVKLPLPLLERLGCVPSYYLRYFYAHDQVVAELRNEPTRGEAVAEIERKLLDIYADPSVTTKPELLSQRGGAFYSEAALGLIHSLLTGDGSIHPANVRNHGHLPFLADEAVIEVNCRVDQGGPTPLPITPVGPVQAGLIAAVSAYEELALDAALRGGRDRVYRALLAHPLVGQHELAEGLTDRLLAANTAHLAWAAR